MITNVLPRFFMTQCTYSTIFLSGNQTHINQRQGPSNCCDGGP